LEFDIGFLLDLSTFISSAACADFRTIACALQSVFTVTGKSAHPTPAAASDPATGQTGGYGIWYARDGIVKAGQGREMLKTRAT
jgi:hypothetical protein